jgi:hypothetical protein
MLGQSSNLTQTVFINLTLIFGFCFSDSSKLDLIIEFDKERKKIVNSIGTLTD